MLVVVAVMKFVVGPHRGGEDGISLFSACLRCCAGGPLILIDASFGCRRVENCRLMHHDVLGLKIVEPC